LKNTEDKELSRQTKHWWILFIVCSLLYLVLDSTEEWIVRFVTENSEYMMPLTWASIIVISFACLITIIIILSPYKNKPIPYTDLIYTSVELIICGIIFLLVLSHNIKEAESLLIADSDVKDFFNYYLISMNIIAYIVPAISVALGANLITQYVVRDNSDAA